MQPAPYYARAARRHSDGGTRQTAPAHGRTTGAARGWAPGPSPTRRVGRARVRPRAATVDRRGRGSHPPASRDRKRVSAGHPCQRPVWLAGAFGTRHLRAVEPTTSGAYGEGPMWVMGVTFGVSIVRAASSRGAPLASGSHLGGALVSASLVSVLAASRRGPHPPPLGRIGKRARGISR